MRILDQLRAIKRLHYFISIKGTGNSFELSKKLKLSRATMFRYQKVLTSLGAEIEYCYAQESYYYRKKFQLDLDSLIF